MAIFNDKQLREVFHLLFLERLLRTSEPKWFALKGGVNLRFFCQSPRYSEDIDLDVYGVSVSTLKKNVYKILEDASFRRSLQTYGIESLNLNDPAKAKQTETTQRFRLRLVNQAGEAFPTKVEFSRRIELDQSLIRSEMITPALTLPYRRLSFICPHYVPEVAVTQKVLALGGRNETQARDVFDLYILYRAGYVHSEKIRASLSDVEREKAQLALMSLDFEAYQGQVIEYLESPAKDEYSTQKAWSVLRQTVLECIG